MPFTLNGQASAKATLYAPAGIPWFKVYVPSSATDVLATCSKPFEVARYTFTQASGIAAPLGEVIFPENVAFLTRTAFFPV